MNRCLQRILAALALFLLGPAWADKPPIRVGVYDSYPVCQATRSDGKGGLFVSLLDHIAAEEDWEIEYVPCFYSRCLEKLGQGEIDLLTAVSYSPEATQKYDFNQETVLSTWAQVYAPPGTEMKSLLDLADLFVGVVNGDVYGKELRSIVRRLNIPCTFVEFKAYGEVLKGIEKGWIDTGVVDRLYGVANETYHHVFRTPIIFSPVELRFASFKGRNPSLLAVLDYHLSQLKKDPGSIYHGLIQELLDSTGRSETLEWIERGLPVALGLLLLFGGWSYVLRQRVKVRTAELSQKNEELRNEIAMRRSAEGELKKHHERLKELVEERTADLQAANVDLQDEISERIRAEREIRKLNEELERRVKRRTEALEKANDELKALDQMKDAFLSSVSHELRTPLTSIRSYTEILLRYDDESHETRQEFLEIILNESERLTRLINEFLDLSKIEAGRIAYRDGLVCLEAIIRKVARAQRQLLCEKGLRLHVDIEPGLRRLVADGDRIQQVMTNLLGNAIKFSFDKGGIFIRAASCLRNRTGTPETWVKVSVTDQGIGIDEKDFELIFDKFGQVSSDTLTDKPRGTGLGLPICREIISHYGGDIWVESERGKGSTFSFTLPGCDGQAARVREGARQPDSRVAAPIGTASRIPPKAS